MDVLPKLLGVKACLDKRWGLPPRPVSVIGASTGCHGDKQPIPAGVVWETLTEAVFAAFLWLPSTG